MIKLEPGVSYLLQFDQEDETNINSSIISYFQSELAEGDFKKQITNQLMMSILDQPFFDDLRTLQQLGYVVFAGDSDSRGVLGSYFLI